MIIQVNHLYSRDKKLKIRVLIIESGIYGTSSVDAGVGFIRRKTGLLDGALIDQPLILIKEGKVKRTVEQQLELELNAIIKKQQDKGYEKFTSIMKDDTLEDADPMNYELIDNLLPKLKTDATGNRKPMLAKDPKAGSKAKEGDFFDDKDWYASAKLDGLRCKGILNVAGNKIDFYSRTGKQFKGSVHRFEHCPILIQFLKDHPGYEVDGEIYAHGESLNKISGDVRKEVYDPERHDYLQYHIFDLPIDNVPASTRFMLLDELDTRLNGTVEIQVVKHYPVFSWDQIMKYHNQMIIDGYEGAMVQLQRSAYEFGTRSSSMWKIKLFQDAEFQIAGYKLGLRGAEDMCFIMQLPNGKTFEAKPQGNKALKESYIDDFDELLGKMATVKFFNYTVYGIPNLPSFKCVREE